MSSRYLINPVKCECGVRIHHNKKTDDDEVICWKCGSRYWVTI